jgi:hypothetical protein
MSSIACKPQRDAGPRSGKMRCTPGVRRLEEMRRKFSGSRSWTASCRRCRAERTARATPRPQPRPRRPPPGNSGARVHQSCIHTLPPTGAQHEHLRSGREHCAARRAGTAGARSGYPSAHALAWRQRPEGSRPGAFRRARQSAALGRTDQCRAAAAVEDADRAEGSDSASSRRGRCQVEGAARAELDLAWNRRRSRWHCSCPYTSVRDLRPRARRRRKIVLAERFLRR